MASDSSAQEVVQNLREVIGPSGGWKRNALGAIEANKEVRKLQRLKVDPVTELDGAYPLLDMLNGLQNRYDQDYKQGMYLQGTFVIADLDGLHKTNEKYGKLAGGDEYFRSVARALKEVSRGRGRCFRSGDNADEMVLYLPGFKVRKEIDVVLDEIDNTLSESEKSLQEKYPGIKFGLSYSVATFHKAYGPKEAYKDATNALSEAKKSKTGERVENVGRFFVNELTLADKKYE